MPGQPPPQVACMKPSVLLEPEQLGDGHIQVSKGSCEGVSCLDVLGLPIVDKPHLIPPCLMSFAFLLVPINWPHQPCRHLHTAPWRVLWGFEHDEFFLFSLLLMSYRAAVWVRQ